MAAELMMPLTRAPKTKVHACPGEKRRTFIRHAHRYCRIGVPVVITVVIVVAALTYHSYRGSAELIDQQIAGGYLRSHAGLYAAPRVIERGARLRQDQLAIALQRAGYAPNRASNIWNGSFQLSDRSIRILPREGTDSHQWIDINFDDRGYISSLSTNDGSQLPTYSLEPELLTVDAGLKTGQQDTLTYQRIPPVLVQAILSIEDRRFFEHNGVDIRGIARAFLRWSTSGSLNFTQGGSTITQQLVKNIYLTPEKTLRRKFNEVMLAVAMEQRLSKQDIFALYCNEVYLGQRNGVGVRGVAQAAKVYFGKDLKDISLAEAATIAGMIQSPARYAPDRHPTAARARRDTVIAAMANQGFINAEASRTEQAQPLTVAAFDGGSNELAPYYVDAVNRAMERIQVGSEFESEQTVRVETTIDPDLQSAAENALRRQLEALNKSGPGKGQVQGAMVAIDPRTGNVLAMVGGRSYEESQLNRATDAKRQPGSVFKPFVYAAAFEAGISPLSTYSDTPQTFQYDHATYSPVNYRRAYSMHDVLLREGLVRSLNVVTVDLAMRTGLTQVASTAARFGLPKPDAYPSMALGAFEATPLQMAAAYSVFANGGTTVEPTVISKVIDNSSGEIIETAATPREQVIKPATAYLITDILSDVTRRGTARGASAAFKHVAIAGKTGTSRDGWFVGYTPNLVCAVWVGFDDNRQLGITGAEGALPAWIEFMTDALAIRPSLGGSTFRRPAGIVTVKIDPETGELAGPNCPTSQTINVPARFVPGECFKHLPEVESIEDNSSTASLIETDMSNEDSDALDAEESADERSSPNLFTNERNDEIETPIPPKVYKRTTEISVGPTGRAELISAPVLNNNLPKLKITGRGHP